MKKRILAAVLGLILLIPAQLVYARTDDFIFSDPVMNTFSGHREGAQLINNLRFTDMPGDHGARDAIIRSGAYNLFKGTGPLFRPNAAMTIEEALAFVLRAAGYEAAAQVAGAAALDTLPPGATAQDVIALGYLALARDRGMITADQFSEAFAPPIPEGVALPVEVVTFRRTDPVTREQFAHWLVLAVVSRNAAAFAVAGPHTQQQAIYGFADWNAISPEFLQSVEQLARTGVMTGAGGAFRPRAYITRMEAAWVGRALDSIYHGIAGLERVYGTVAGISDAQAVTAHYGELWREVRVRRYDGQVDILRFATRVGGSPQVGTQDAVVLRDGVVGGLGSLAIGDPIEYIVHPASGTVLYVVVTGAFVQRQAMGRLQTINFEANTATFLDPDGRAHTYALAQGLLRVGPDGNPDIRLGPGWYPIRTLPLGSFFTIDLANSVIRGIQFAGNYVIQPEVWGVVIENNPMLGFLTIFNAQGNEVSFSYNVGELTVQKREHFDMRDTIGGVHAMFPNMRFNPLETSMSAIEPGNVVSFRTDPANPSMIISIHASTNYTTRYGRILDINTIGNVQEFLMEFENGRTARFTMPGEVMIRRDGRPISPAQVQPGDWARLLINQAIMAPGHVIESIRAMDLEGDARHITGFITGQLSGINRIQNQMIIQNAVRWTPGSPPSPLDFSNVDQFSTTNPQISYFLNGNPVSLGYVNEFLRLSNAEVVMALETAHGGERISVVSFFNPPRIEHLRSDTVVGVDGHGGFNILSTEGTIRTDDGTIVVRNGRLVSGRQIMPWDHVNVTLAGENRAAIVDISPAPNFGGVQIARGRIQSVDQGRSFRVQSMALFDGLNWHFTPIEREFTIDHGTLFMTDSGLMDINDFIDYTENTVVNQVFNVVIDGSRAARVTDAPYATQSIRGIIYNIEGDTISLRNVHVRNAQTGVWSIISNINATGTANVLGNSIIVDRDQVVSASNLQIGQQVRIMTTTLPTAAPGMEVNGYIVLVER